MREVQGAGGEVYRSTGVSICVVEATGKKTLRELPYSGWRAGPQDLAHRRYWNGCVITSRQCGSGPSATNCFFLEPLNSMASNSGGFAVHGWGEVPFKDARGTVMRSRSRDEDGLHSSMLSKRGTLRFICVDELRRRSRSYWSGGDRQARGQGVEAL